MPVDDLPVLARDEFRVQLLLLARMPRRGGVLQGGARLLDGRDDNLFDPLLIQNIRFFRTDLLKFCSKISNIFNNFLRFR